MIKHIDLKDFALAKRCNYAEYTFVVNKLADMLSGEDKSMLNFPKGVFERFQDGATKMLDTLNSSRATAETTKIENMNKLLNKHLVYILGVVRLAKNSGIEDKCEAAKELYCITKMYRKTRRAPRRQKSSQIGSLIYELNSPKAAELIKKLSLTEEVNTLTQLNDEYLKLLKRRADIQVSNSKDKPALIRKEMNSLLNIMLTCIRCAYYTNPTEKLTQLILSINKLFCDITTEYKQRLAHRKKEDNTTQPTLETQLEMQVVSTDEKKIENTKLECSAHPTEAYKPSEGELSKVRILADTLESRNTSGEPRIT